MIGIPHIQVGILLAVYAVFFWIYFSMVILSKDQDVQKNMFTFLRVLSEEVESKYTDKPRKFHLYGINKKPISRYYKMLKPIVLYLSGFSKEHPDHPFEFIVKDFTALIYGRLNDLGITPMLNNFTASAENRIEFESWIGDYMKNNGGEGYWIVDKVNIKRIKAKAKRLAQLHKYYPIAGNKGNDDVWIETI